MTRKHWFGWAAVAVFAVLLTVIFWSPSGRSRSKQPASPSAATEGAPVSNEAPVLPPSPRQVEPALPSALPDALGATAPASVSPSDGEDDVPESTDVEKAQVARLPVIYAIRGEYPNEEARFEAMRAALHRSGPSTEAWTSGARAIFERWGAALEGTERTVDGSSLRCYVAGCEVLVTFPGRAAFDQGAAKFRGIPDQISMGRVQTPGVDLPDGRVQVSWMLMRPDTAPPNAG